MFDDSRKDAIDSYVDAKTDKERVAALFLLGRIELEAGNVPMALHRWREVAKKYPDTPEGLEAQEHLGFLGTTAKGLIEYSTSISVAMTYLARGDEWARNRGPMIYDSSWISPVEAAAGWYDRVVERYPGTPLAEYALLKKFQTLLGWTEPSGAKVGAARNPPLWAPKIAKEALRFEEAFPQSRYLQMIRFQVAQLYWSSKNMRNAKKWLKRVIEDDKEGDSFVADMARLRLQNLR